MELVTFCVFVCACMLAGFFCTGHERFKYLVVLTGSKTQCVS
jgi:hypothetical protein